MNIFTDKAQSLGWTMKDLAKRWGITPRQMSRIAGRPKQLHWDALRGIEEKRK